MLPTFLLNKSITTKNPMVAGGFTVFVTWVCLLWHGWELGKLLISSKRRVPSQTLDASNPLKAFCYDMLSKNEETKSLVHQSWVYNFLNKTYLVLIFVSGAFYK